VMSVSYRFAGYYFRRRARWHKREKEGKREEGFYQLEQKQSSKREMKRGRMKLC
jgi:hypothetical protein